MSPELSQNLSGWLISMFEMIQSNYNFPFKKISWWDNFIWAKFSTD